MSQKLIGAACLAFLVVSTSGCSSSSKLKATKTVGAQGGTITLGNGVSLDIPAGALAADTELGVEVLADLVKAGYAAAPVFVDGLPSISVALTPHGTTFKVPVSLTLPYTGDETELALLRLANQEATDWEPIGPITFASGLVKVSLSQFSTYTLAKVAAGSCPCYNGAILKTMTTVAAGKGIAPYPPLTTNNYEKLDTKTGQSTTNVKIAYSLGIGALVVSADVNARRCAQAGTSCRGTINPAKYQSASCSLNTSGEPTWFGEWFPGVTPSLVRPWILEPYTNNMSSLIGYNLNHDQVAACAALLGRAFEGKRGVQLAYNITGLPDNEFVAIGLQGLDGSVIATNNDELAWGPVLDSGASYTVEIQQQPATATCTADPVSGTLTENAVVNITCVPAAQVSVEVTPSTVTLCASATQTFTATVSHASNTAVTWSATGGSITSGGVYTAPVSGTDTVRATSVADATKYGEAAVTVSSYATDVNCAVCGDSQCLSCKAGYKVGATGAYCSPCAALIDQSSCEDPTYDAGHCHYCGPMSCKPIADAC